MYQRLKSETVRVSLPLFIFRANFALKINIRKLKTWQTQFQIMCPNTSEMRLNEPVIHLYLVPNFLYT